MRVIGTLDSAPQAQYALDFYISSACNTPADNGEAEQVLGTLQATTGANNIASYTFTSTTVTSLTAGVVTATATRTSNGDTSEFSACVPLSS